MPRKPKKTQPQTEAAKPFDEFVDDSESGGEDEVTVDANGESAPSAKLRDWRDVEKFKEERLLRKLIGDQLDFEELERPRRR
ncbi:MAG TPA: hypothetical protein VM074_09235 [Solimonas sp.]|nr:hypothetical protein [Solimonas sp.]